MTPERILKALNLPPEALTPRRVPKKLLSENGAATARDRRLIQEGIDRIVWEASIKPAHVGVPVFQDAEREYLEIAVLSGAFHSTAKTLRLIELIHRAIPYPVLSIVATGDETTVSLAHKRWSQAESTRVVLDGAVASVTLGNGSTADEDFVASLGVDGLPRAHLHALYQGWMDRLTALLAARKTGAFRLADSPRAAAERVSALDEHESLERRIAELRAQAGKAVQMKRRVELNLDIKRLEADAQRLGAAL